MIDFVHECVPIWVSHTYDTFEIATKYGRAAEEPRC
jgi:hypothetical protein